MKTILLAVAAFGAVFSSAGLASAVPSLLSHQGRLYDSNDQPVSGAVDMEFALYATEAAGAPVWTETHSVTFEDGYYSVTLGSSTPFGNDIDGSQLFLGITVGSDPEMAPRSPVNSVPYALIANNATGDITPNTVVVGGGTVIDASGQWVGDPSGLVGPQGPQGPQGNNGAAGGAGPTGPSGAVGPAGPLGPTGPAGPTGAAGAAGAQGPQGNTGAQGPQGLTGPQGATGGQGPAGPAGPAGAAGAQGPQGGTGATGAAGAAGSQGAAGPQGAAGSQGPAGPQGIVGQASTSGGAAAITTATAFISPTVSVTITAGQKIFVVSQAALGAGATAATGLNLYVCYSSGTVSAFGGGTFGLTAPANQRLHYGLNAIITLLPAGTYSVGLCGSATTPANWNNNEWAYTSAIVFN